MLSGIAASTASFLIDLNSTEQRISRDNQQLSSGIRVNVASDDPAAVTPLLDDQNQIAQITQLLSNLNRQQPVVSTADGALQTASGLMNQLISIGTQGATGTATADSRTSLGEQVQQIQQELVSLANTNVQGQYVFGGDASHSQPYTYDWSSSEGVVSSGSPTNTTAIYGLDGSSIIPGLTAGQIFDAQLPNGGGPDPGNVFQAVYQLGTALFNNDQTAIQNAVASLQTAAAHVSQSSTVYGDVENWIQQTVTTANSRSSNLTNAISGLRDTDIAAAATDLSQGQVAMDAALSAQASLPTKSLFNYLA
jgi:flagellar hook-associated protein 3 FlgL